MDQVVEYPKLTKSTTYFGLRQEIEEFFYEEADILDERRFEEWLDCFTDDLVYVMPIRHNVKFGQHAERENTRAGEGISWFDEGKWTLGKRIEQILTGVHYAEEPLSRVAHLITNVRIRGVSPNLEDPEEVRASCRFHVYLNRVEYETYSFIGRRNDTLRRVDDEWKVSRREIILDQNVLLAKNLTTFF